LAGQFTPDFNLSLSAEIDRDATYRIRVGTFRNRTPDPNSYLMKELAKMEACLEKELRAGGINREFLAGGTLNFHYPFLHGSFCADPVDDE
jgi:hypothetical protein